MLSGQQGLPLCGFARLRTTHPLISRGGASSLSLAMRIRTLGVKKKSSVLVAAGLLVASCALPILERSFAQQTVTPVTNQGRRLSLRDQLVSGLRAFTKSDLAFINSVVLAVEQGRVPRRVVDGTFLWARDRAARRSYRRRLRPMVYFQPAMTARAKRLGVAL